MNVEKGRNQFRLSLKLIECELERNKGLSVSCRIFFVLLSWSSLHSMILQLLPNRKLMFALID